MNPPFNGENHLMIHLQVWSFTPHDGYMVYVNLCYLNSRPHKGGQYYSQNVISSYIFKTKLFLCFQIITLNFA